MFTFLDLGVDRKLFGLRQVGGGTAQILSQKNGIQYVFFPYSLSLAHI